MEIAEEERRHAFSMWLRTGRWPVARGADGTELKFNPWHDPKDGRFTFANSGNYGGGGWGDGGFSGGGGGGFGGGGASGNWQDPVRPKKPPHPKPPVATIQPKRDAAKPAPAASTIGKTTEPLRHVTQNGYDFGIDSGGRTKTVSGNLGTADTPLRSRTAQKRAGGADRRSSDDGGHYIAVRFNGPTDAFNHFAQDANFNRGRYRALEDQWARAKKARKSVFVKIMPAYEGKSQRPSVIDIRFIIDGHPNSIKIPNESGKTHHGK
ncbi:MAG: DNA/RNA non-specific endonuclease [Sphingomonas bacterium]